MRFLLDFLFPKTCLGCGKKGQYFCQHCISQIKLVNQICPVCTKPSFFGQVHPRCKTKLFPDGLISVFSYEGITRDAIRKLKFKYVTDLAKEFFKIVEKILEEKDHFSLIKQYISDKKPVIIPMPLHWYKENFRGFNQAEIFGQKLAEKFNLEIKKNILIRSQFTQSQFGLDKKSRKNNVENAFTVNPNIHGSLFNILLVDDIWTTGVTLKTCASLLKKSGAEMVWGLTLAR